MWATGAPARAASSAASAIWAGVTGTPGCLPTVSPAPVTAQVTITSRFIPASPCPERAAPAVPGGGPRNARSAHRGRGAPASRRRTGGAGGLARTTGRQARRRLGGRRRRWWRGRRLGRLWRALRRAASRELVQLAGVERRPGPEHALEHQD